MYVHVFKYIFVLKNLEVRTLDLFLLQKPGMDLADTYIMFVRQNQDILRDKINEEMYIEKLFDVSSCLCEGYWLIQ